MLSSSPIAGRRLALLLGLLAFLSLRILSREPIVQTPPEEVKIGMPLNDVQVNALRGKAAPITRQVFYKGHVEQWTFKPQALRIEVEFRRGDPPKVLDVRSLPARP